MRIYLTGADGMLGTALTRVLSQNRADCTVRGVSVLDFDIARGDAVDASIDAFAPDVIVHAGAIAVVDECEADPGRAMRVNVAGTCHVARAARRHGARMVYLSSDYVFDGASTPGRGYTENDVPNPLSVYGLTKLAGERIAATLRGHLIIRTSWLFGGTDESTDNVLSTIRQALRGKQIRLINDQYGSPTYTADLAAAIAFLIRTGVTGTVHAVSAGAATWFQAGVAALGSFDAELARSRRPEPVRLADCPFLGVRPPNSVLSNARLAGLGFTMPHWSDAVRRFSSALASANGAVR